MRAVRYHDHGGPEVLTVEDVDLPDPGYDEVRIEVRAAGVNPVDTYLREGSASVPMLPQTPGADVAGDVDAVGPGVEDVAVGDRVFGTCLGGSRPGTYAEEVVAPVSNIAILPDGITYREGAAIALVGVTAWRALIDHGSLAPAERCLIHGANGGVGHIAVQLAAAAGASVTGTAQPQFHSALSDLGADDVIDYDQEPDTLATTIRAIEPPDVILDHRVDEYLDLDVRVAAQGGRIIGVGDASEGTGRLPDIPMGRRHELAVQLMSVFNTPDVGAVLDRLASLLRRGEVAPDIARTYSLDDAAAAHRDVMEDSVLGKLVLHIDQE